MINFINSLNNKALLDILLLSHDATAIYTGENLKIELVNDAMLTLWGKEQNVHGQNFEDALPEMSSQPFTRLLKEVWRTGISYQAKDTPVKLLIDGELQTFYFDFNYRAIKDENGQMYCILHTTTEVSDRIKAWDEVRIREEKENEYREALAAANEEYQATNEELNALNEELHTSNEQLLKLENELNLANKLLKQLNIDLNHENKVLGIAEQKAIALFEDAPVAIGMLTGRELLISNANPELLKLWGKGTEIIGKPLREALPELEGQPYLNLLLDVLNNGTPYHGNEQKVYLYRDGKLAPYYFNIVYKPVTDTLGNIHSVMLVANEITDQVEARKLVEDANERLELALNAGSLGSYDLDLGTGKMQCSEQCKRNFGLKSEDQLNYESLLNAVLPEFRNYVQEQIQTAINNKQIYSAEYEIRWPDGARRWIQATGRPRYNEQGKAVRIVGVTLDITERKAYEQRKDDFLGIASHELKTPITVLKANLQMLERMKPEIKNPTAIKLIENATGSMGKIHNLVEDLLNISKHSEGKIELNKSWFDLNEVLESCCNHVKIDGKHDLKIHSTLSLKVYADEHRIEQVLVNFVNNAVKYAPDSKDIRLSAGYHENQVRVSVQDYGKGITEDQLPHLFDRYWQVNPTSEKYTGLGLGLYICAEIIKRHGGEIGVKSEAGKGSTFWFTLPEHIK